MAEQSIEVSRTVSAPPERAFALLADPDRHPDLDGSGMIRGSGTHLAITELGDVFVMHMHSEEAGDYDVANVVTVYEPDRAIGWRPAEVGGDPSGHTFTWRFQPADDGDDTVVTLVYDWSQMTRLVELMPLLTPAQLEDSLERLEHLLR